MLSTNHVSPSLSSNDCTRCLVGVVETITLTAKLQPLLIFATTESFTYSQEMGHVFVSSVSYRSESDGVPPSGIGRWRVFNRLRRRSRSTRSHPSARVQSLPLQVVKLSNPLSENRKWLVRHNDATATDVRANGRTDGNAGGDGDDWEKARIAG